MSTTVTTSPPRGQAAPRRRVAGGQALRPRRRWLRLPRASTTPGKLWLVRAFGGLEAGIIVLALLMAIGCAWGMTVRLTEYR